VSKDWDPCFVLGATPLLIKQDLPPPSADKCRLETVQTNCKTNNKQTNIIGVTAFTLIARQSTNKHHWRTAFVLTKLEIIGIKYFEDTAEVFTTQERHKRYFTKQLSNFP